MEVSLYSDTDYRLWVLLARTEAALLKARKIELTQCHISAIEAFALFILNDIGKETTAAELSRRMSRQHNTAMALLRRMEKKGLVAKTRDPEKANSWRVSLTREGETACRQAAELTSIHGAMSGLSDDDKRELESLLRNIHDNALRESTVELAFP